MPSEVGSGQVAIFPVFKGFRKAVLSQVDGTVSDGSKRFNRGFTTAASDAGGNAGRGFNKSFSANTGDLGQASLSSLQKAVASTSAANSRARLAEQDAIGKVNVAQAGYNATIAKYAAGSPQFVRASENLASAQRRASAAGEAAKLTWSSMTSAQNNLKNATENAASSATRSQGAFSRIGSSISSGIGGGMSTAISLVSSGITTILGIAAAGAVTVGATVGAALTAGFSRLSTIETAQAKLKALGNDAATIKEIMANANDAVIGTQYSLADAITGAASATAAGIKPGKDLTKYLKLQANAAALAGVGFSDLGLVMNQVQSQNKAYTQDLNQVASRGIPIYQSLATVYGTTQAGLRDLLQAGEVDADHFRAALELNVGNAADEIGKTTVGSFENMKAAFSRFGAVLVSPIYGGFKHVFDGVITGLDSMKNIIQPLVDKYGPKLQEVFKPFTDKIGPTLSDFFGDIEKAANSPEGQKWFSDMGDNLEDIAQALGDSLPTLVEFTKQSLKLTAALLKLGSEAAPSWIHGAQQIGDFAGLVTKNLSTATESINTGTFWSTIKDKFNNGSDQIKDFFEGGPITGNLIASINRNFDTVGKSVETGNFWTAIASKFDNGKLQIQGVEDQIVASFENGWLQIQTGTSIAWDTITGKFDNGGQQIQTAVTTAWETITGKFDNGAQQIGSFFTSLGASFANGAQQIGSFATDVGTNIGKAQDFIRGLPGQAAIALADVGTKLFSSGKALIDGFTDGIKSAAKDTVKAVSNLIKDVAGFFPNSPAKHGPLSGAGWTKLGRSGAAILEQATQGLDVGPDGLSIVSNAVTSLAGTSTGSSGSSATSTGPGGSGNVYIGQIVAPDQNPVVSGRIMGREFLRLKAG